jgi:integrase
MPRQPKFTPRETSQGWCVNSPASLTKSGKREQHFFRTKQAAKDHAKKMRERFMAHGASAGIITPVLASDATAAAALLKPWGLSLLEAARVAVAMRETQAASAPVEQAVAAWLLSCEGLADRTLTTYTHSLKGFLAKHGPRKLSSLSAEEIAEGLGIVGAVGAAAANNYRTGRAFWRWAAKKKWCALETFAQVDSPRASKATNVELLTLAQVKTLLKTAAEIYPESVACYAVLLFSGIRPSEFARLQTEDVTPEGIEINSDSKIKKRRHITPNTTLQSWLQAHPFQRLTNWRRIDQVVRRMAGFDVWIDPDFFTAPEDEPGTKRVPWPADATRHTFASYSINAGVKLDDFLFEFGHSGNTRTLKTHYLGRCTKADAAAFFGIRPGTLTKAS